jgi:peptidoglycan hydrolase CwlO-like protein
MKKAFIYSLAISLIMLSSVGAETPKKEEAKSTPTEESSKLATKQIDQEITELRRPLKG